MTERFTAQKNMILGQILPQRVTNPQLLAVLARIPRKMFVPETYEGVACIDGPVPLGYNRYMIAPHIFSTLLSKANISDDNQCWMWAAIRVILLQLSVIWHVK